MSQNIKVYSVGYKPLSNKEDSRKKRKKRAKKETKPVESRPVRLDSKRVKCEGTVYPLPHGITFSNAFDRPTLKLKITLDGKEIKKCLPAGNKQEFQSSLKTLITLSEKGETAPILLPSEVKTSKKPINRKSIKDLNHLVETASSAIDSLIQVRKKDLNAVNKKLDILIKKKKKLSAEVETLKRTRSTLETKKS